MKCCTAPVHTNTPSGETFEFNVTVVDGGSYQPADTWNSQCPKDYAVKGEPNFVIIFSGQTI